MVHAILRLVEQDGTVYPPEMVEIVAACCWGHPDCVEVRNGYGEPLFVTHAELSDE